MGRVHGEFGFIRETMRTLILLCFLACAFVMAESSSDADSDPFYSYGGLGGYTGYGSGSIQTYNRFGSYGSYGSYGGFGGVTASGQSYGRRWKGKRAAEYF